MKSFVAVAALAGLASAWGPTTGTVTKGSWGTKTTDRGGWGTHMTVKSHWTTNSKGHGHWSTYTTECTTSSPTTSPTYPAWNSTSIGPTGTIGTGTTGASVYTSTGSPIATNGAIDKSAPAFGGLVAVAGLLAAL